MHSKRARLAAYHLPRDCVWLLASHLLPHDWCSEDVETARKAGLPTDPPDARTQQLWRDLASGAESGQCNVVGGWFLMTASQHWLPRQLHEEQREAGHGGVATLTHPPSTAPVHCTCPLHLQAGTTPPAGLRTA